MLRLHTLKICLAVLLAALFALLPPQTTGAQGLNAQAGSADGIWLRSPARRAPDAPPPMPAELPPGADDVTPLTLEVVIRRQYTDNATTVVRQTVSRTLDRVHVEVAGGREWLFERNPLDPRRVSGLLVDHASRTIVLHEESDLRNMLGINGWADVLLIGFDPSALSLLKPTGQARTLGGIRLMRYAAEQKDAGVSEVWWNQEQALPAAFVTIAGGRSTRVSTERLRSGVKPERLRSPSVRFPAYKLVDLAEWLEGH